MDAAAIFWMMSPFQMVSAAQGDREVTMRDIPKWEATSIKRCTGAPNTSPDSLSSNRMVLNCKRLEALAHLAYDMFATGKKRDIWNAQKTRYEGFPEWAKSERYMIEAKAEGSPGEFTMAGPSPRHPIREGHRVSSTPVLRGLHHEYFLEKVAA